MPSDSSGWRPKIGLVLGGIGPPMMLLAGAMRAFDEADIEFDVISTTGAGSLVGMTYLAPQGNRPRASVLRDLAELYVSDALYSLLPVNFKAFRKYGRFSQPVWQLGKAIPRFPVLDGDPSESCARLANDWIDMWVTALTPTTLTSSSKGLMAHPPIVNEFVDFDELSKSSTRFYMNAFSNSDRRLALFCNQNKKDPITAEHYEAAQSMLFLFPPKRIKSKVYSTGLTHEPTALQALWSKQSDGRLRDRAGKTIDRETDGLDLIVAFDPLTEAYLREPTDIYDAFQLMLMGPIASLYDNIMMFYSEIEYHANKEKALGFNIPPIYCVPFLKRKGTRGGQGKIKPEYFPDILKWSRSNALELEKIGYQAAKEFSDHLLDLSTRLEKADAKNRATILRNSQLTKKYRYHDLVPTPKSNKTHESIGKLMGVLAGTSKDEMRQSLPSGSAASEPGQGRPTSGRDAPPWWTEDTRRGVLLCGGAPTLHISAGAMCAFYEQEVSFDMVATSGAGALPGLLYAAPKNKDPAAALRASIELNIDDLIFDVIPSNFKVFQKQGPFSEMFWEFGRRLPHYDPGSSTSDLASIQRLYNDCLDFVIAAITPTTLNFASKGVCTRITQLLDDIVDWDGLREYPKQYYLNAFNLDTDKLELFDKRTLTHNSFFAALAMPWLFESRTVDGHRYTEGASHDPTSLEAVWDARGLNAEHFDEIVIVESITSEMWNDPRGLYDSLRLTIMDPVVSLAEQVLAAYGAFEYKWNAYIERLYRKKGKEVPRSERMPKLYVVPCDVSEPQSPNILEWSRSNGELLWWIGYERAEEFCKHFLPLSNSSRREARLKEYRYFYRLENGRIESRQKWARIKPFLELFDPIFDRLK